MRPGRVPVLVVILAGAAPALADRAPVATEITASSTRGRGKAHAAWRAFDADTNTAWCPAATDDATGGSIVVRFAQPVTVRSLEIFGQRQRLGEDEEPPAPLALTVTSDAGAVTVAFDATTEEQTAVAPPVGATRSLTFHLGPRPAGGPAGCFSEIHLELVDHALVYGAPPAAVAALPAALTTLDDALRRCDRKALARLAHFPVGFREIAMGQRREYPPDAETDSDPRAFRRPRDLPCTWSTWAGYGDEGQPPIGPTLDAGIAPGVVRVYGGAAITTVYWELAWRGRRWQLISLDTVFFE